MSKKSSSLLLLLLWFGVNAWTQPEGFHDELVVSGLRNVNGLTFDESGRIFLWAKAGQVWIYDETNGLYPEPLIDISEEVLNRVDHGLLGFALHPNFLNNGYFYLLYPVDRHHLLHYGTAAYDPTQDDFSAPTIGRLTRYTADPSTNFSTVLTNSREVLIGESIDTGIPLLHNSHGMGSLVFGPDGSLLLSCGDGASYSREDLGGTDGGASGPTAVLEGIIQAKEDVGAFRSQVIYSHSGKILRIDPATGDGLPSNPFFDSMNPRSPQSRVWALGLRNPYRFVHIPGTGSHHIEDGDPGVLIIGDVGWGDWEEINIVREGGQNFGWPIYEGFQRRWQYHAPNIEHPDAPNPLFGDAGCSRPNFLFKELLLQESIPSPFFPNPCSDVLEIPNTIPHFVHQRPSLVWSNFEWNITEQNTYVPAFDVDGNAIHISLEDADSPVEGHFFNGNCTLGGVMYQDGNFPAPYNDGFYFGDYTGWIRRMELNENSEIVKIDSFFQGAGKMVMLTQHPENGCIYYLNYGFNGELRKVCFGSNPPPTAIIDVDQQYGPGPMTVQFSASQSFDPEGEPISYLWDFGDGESSTEMDPSHTFTSNDDKPVGYSVQLTVMDTAGGSHAADVVISLNNTPPIVEISSISPGQEYTTTGTSEIPLKAIVSDAEHGDSELEYAWQTFLHHNSHFHPEEIDDQKETSTLIGGEGCTDETYWYRVRLTVTDAAGLSAYDERELFPYCGDPLVKFESMEAEAFVEYVEIHWSVENEWPELEYQIERSANGLHFEAIGQQIQTGESVYQFQDPLAIHGENFYRVRAIRPDGFFEYSPTVQAIFPGQAFLDVYPNPVLDEMTVWIRKFETEARFVLMDLQGRVVFQNSWTGPGVEVEQSIKLSHLNSGMYLYMLTDGIREKQGKLIKID